MIDLTTSGCLNCKWYRPDPRGCNTPRCAYNGCKFEARSPYGEIGRRKGLKIPRPHGHPGSSPGAGTT